MKQKEHDRKIWNRLSSQPTDVKIRLWYGDGTSCIYNNIHYIQSYINTAFSNQNVEKAQVFIRGVANGEIQINSNFVKNFAANLPEPEDELPF